MKHEVKEDNRQSKIRIDPTIWGNPIDVPQDDIERYYYNQNGPEKEENERSILIKTFQQPTKSKFKSDLTSGKSKKVMSISTLKSSQQRRRRRRRRQLDLNVSTDCSLEGHYNFIENSSGFHSTYGTKKRRAKQAAKKAIEEKQSNTLKAVQKSGLVNTKISVYEKNLGSAKNDNRQLRDSKRKKAVLGVPLVGMQNTNATLPVFSKTVSGSWNNFNSEQQMNAVNSKAMHSSRAPSAISSRNEKEKTPTKRRAPAVPNNIANSEPISQLARTTAALNKDSPALNNNFRKSQNSTVSYPSKFTKNPYSTSRNSQPRFARDYYQVVESTKVSSTTMTPQSTFISLRGSDGKRKTLYAKDAEGEEAIRVLTNLCLNPLARNSKRASFMMW